MSDKESPFPHLPYASADLVTQAIPEDERLWVPQADNVWFRPLLLNRVNGEWINLLRVRKSGVLSRHRHPAPVHGYVIKGSWRYLEHDWVATAGDYAFEPAGETHTLVVEDSGEPMITLFHVTGGYTYVDPNGVALGYEDVFTKLDATRAHFAANDLDKTALEDLIR